MATSIHPTAVVSPRAVLADDVTVGPFTIILDGVELGQGTTVESHCVLGHSAGENQLGPLVIGRHALVRSHSVFYAGSRFDDGLRTGHRVNVREGIRGGQGLHIGTMSDLQGFTSIGSHVRIHSSVFIAQYSTIGDFVWMLPHSVLTNDPRPPSDRNIVGPFIGDYVVLAARSMVMPGVHIGAGSLVAAQALVTRDVPSDTIVSGVPARLLGPTSSLQLKDGSGPAYPWTRHFHRGYPQEVLDSWDLEL